MSSEPALTEHKVTVLLIDDQLMIGETVRRMLAGEPDILFHFCRDAAKAVPEAKTKINPLRKPDTASVRRNPLQGLWASRGRHR